MHPADPNELLCESCGYPLAGMERADPCPECGEPAVCSLPRARPGSPWQRATSLIGSALAAADILERPRRSAREMQIDRQSAIRAEQAFYLLSFLLLILPGWVKSVLVLGHAIMLSGLDSVAIRGAPPLLTPIAYVAYPLVLWLLFCSAVALLSAIERRGIRFFGATRGWRITADVARCVTARAMLGGWLVGVMIAGALQYLDLIAAVDRAVRESAPRSARPDLVASIIRDAVMCGGAIVLGLLPFELLVYLGVRACRYANTPQAAPLT
ncbi:MAG: hypothetical protein ACT4PL_04385 [Phycisphaerales bacterium]